MGTLSRLVLQLSSGILSRPAIETTGSHIYDLLIARVYTAKNLPAGQRKLGETKNNEIHMSLIDN